MEEWESGRYPLDVPRMEAESYLRKRIVEWIVWVQDRHREEFNIENQVGLAYWEATWKEERDTMHAVVDAIFETMWAEPNALELFVE